jgi:hypothetical protein
MWRAAVGVSRLARRRGLVNGTSKGHGPAVINDGATIWTLGWKTEGGGLIWENKNGGRAEVWGGFAYTFGVPADRPAFINTDASLALQVAGMTFMGADGYYNLLVKNTQKGQTTELRRADVVGRASAATIPLYVSISGAQPTLAAAPNDESHSQDNKDMSLKTLVAVTAIAAAPAIVAPQTTTQASAQPAPKTYKAPSFFDGEANGKPDGTRSKWGPSDVDGGANLAGRHL